jgi:hypothetical protein
MILYANLRRALYEATVTFPADKTIGAVTLTGDVVNDFEIDTFGPSRVLVATADDSLVDVDVVVNTYGSWDEGTTYYLIDEDKTLANGTAGALNASIALGNCIPRVRADAVISTLSVGHGCKVDVITEEANQGAKKEITETALVDAVAGIGSVYTPAISLASGELLDYAAVVMVVEDSSNITVGTTIGYKVQTSIDGTYWNDMEADVTDELVVVDTDAPVYIEVEYTANLGKYVRLALTGTTSSALAIANIAVFAILS